MIKQPIIVVDKGGYDLRIYASTEALDSHLEAIDVKNNEYEAYDSEGRVLTLGVYWKKTPILFGLFNSDIERVVIQSAEEEPKHENDLRNAIINNLGDAMEENIQNMSLQQLIQKFIDIHGFV